jgi:hypothetical protein
MTEKLGRILEARCGGQTVVLRLRSREVESDHLQSGPQPGVRENILHQNEKQKPLET